MRKELKAPSPSHSRGTSRLVLAQRPGGLQQELSGTVALAESASLTMLSHVRQVSEMAEDGSEEIMFICKWPAPGPHAGGVTLAAWAKPPPRFAFALGRRSLFAN